MPFECAGCSAGHFSNATILMKEYLKFYAESDKDMALTHFNEAMGELRQAEEQHPDKELRGYIRGFRKRIEAAVAGGEKLWIPNLEGLKDFGVQLWEYLSKNPDLCPTCELERKVSPHHFGNPVPRACDLKKEVVKPKSFFDPESFRTVCPKSPTGRCKDLPPKEKCSTRVIIGCPKGKFKEGVCQVGTQAQVIHHGR